MIHYFITDVNVYLFYSDRLVDLPNKKGIVFDQNIKPSYEKADKSLANVSSKFYCCFAVVGLVIK